MNRPISPTTHGVLDYATVITTAAMPHSLNFPTSARRACMALAATYSALSLLTDYPLGLKRVIPFKAHGAAEVALGAALPAMPWVLGFARNSVARNFFFGLTALTALVASFTDWDAVDEKRRTRSLSRSSDRRLQSGSTGVFDEGKSSFSSAPALGTAARR